jgi:hypothetical protein
VSMTIHNGCPINLVSLSFDSVLYIFYLCVCVCVCVCLQLGRVLCVCLQLWRVVCVCLQLWGVLLFDMTANVYTIHKLISCLTQKLTKTSRLRFSKIIRVYFENRIKSINTHF